MGEAPVLAEEQDRALDRLSRVPELQRYYLAGGTAVAWHLHHRRSRDLDLFSLEPDVDLERLRERLATTVAGIEVVAITDASLRLRVEAAAVDIVRYPYRPLVPPAPGPRGFLVAAPRDLAAMKLATIASRGLRRDFWDLHAIVATLVPLPEAVGAYLQRFGLTQPDVYHLARALVYFVDAERDAVFPAGLSAEHWEEIKAWFRAQAPAIVLSP